MGWRWMLILGFLVQFPGAGALAETAGFPPQQPTPPDWWAAQQEVQQTLEGKKATMAELAEKALQGKPRTGQEAMFRVAVCLRAGLDKALRAELLDLRRLSPELGGATIQNLYYEAFDRLHAPAMAQQVVEVFADTVTELSLENRLLRHFTEKGWTVEQIDRWLSEKPEGKNGFWLKERIAFNVRHGREEPLLQTLTDDLKRHPDDLPRVEAFLDALIRSQGSRKKPWDLAWIPEGIRPGKATVAEELAGRLQTLGHWPEAAHFHALALSIPLDDEEVGRMGMMMQVWVPPDRLTAFFEVRVREGLAECLLKQGKKDEAQALIVEADTLRTRHQMGRNALLAGHVQGLSGGRTVESRIKREEKPSENDPEYWLERARYFQGRAEPDQEEEALKKGLAVAAAEPPGTRHFKGNANRRQQLLVSYAFFLKRTNRTPEAVSLLHREIETAPGSVEAAAAAHQLVMEFGSAVRADDETLWTWLGGRKTWDYSEERVLWKMLENAPGKDLAGCFDRAERLAADDATRQYSLGWVMNRMGFADRSIPLLKRARKTATEKDLRDRSAFTLLESFLETKNWAAAEKIFPEARSRLSPSETSEWLGKIAGCAARAGQKPDALRIWKMVIDMNPSETGELGTLARSGLKEELQKLYRDLQQKLPDSTFPDKALGLLEKE